MTTISVAYSAVLLFVAAHLTLGLSSPSTLPAFLWSPHQDGLKQMVDYRIVSPRDLAKTVMNEGGWSNYLCSREEAQKSQDFAFVFVGSKLQSLDISRPTKTDPALVNLLKDSFSNSNFSLTFPYLAAPEMKLGIESALIAEFYNSCPLNSEKSKIAITASCNVDGLNFDVLKDIHSVNDYMHSNMEKNSDGRSNLIVLCTEFSFSSQDSDQPQFESGILSELVDSVEQLGAKYSILYVSDPFRSSIQYPAHRSLERFLAEGAVGNGSVNLNICDGVCKIKSSLLEGLLVGIVLLVILISGLCCMAGIDTPTRFETPQDS